MSKLSDIVSDMQRQARRNRCVIRELARGLRLQLILQDGHQVLTLSRPAVAPSAEELAICMEAFGVPAGTEPQRSGHEVSYTWPVERKETAK